MNAQDLINVLKQYPPNTPVVTYDRDYNTYDDVQVVEISVSERHKRMFSFDETYNIGDKVLVL